MNGRWFLHTHGLKDTTLYIVNGALMALSFFLLRIVGMAVFGWRILMTIDKLMELPLTTYGLLLPCYVVGYMLQLMWFRKIFEGLIKVFKKMGKKG